MPKKLSKKPSSLEDEIDKILQKKGVGKARSSELRPTREWGPRELAYTRYPLLPKDLFQIWLEILNKVGDLPATEFRDDVTELRQEIDTLRMTVHSLTQELAFSKRRIDELSEKVDKIYPPVETNTIAEACKAYVKMVSGIDIVQKVFLIETMDVATIWTIIDAPPFEDSLRAPIYDAQLHILGMFRDHVPLDFNVLNVSELSENQEPNNIIPVNAKLVWER